MDALPMVFFGARSASDFTAARYYDRPGVLARAQLLFGADVSPATSPHLWCLQSCAGGNDYLLGLGAEKATEVVKSHYATIAPGAAWPTDEDVRSVARECWRRLEESKKRSYKAEYQSAAEYEAAFLRAFRIYNVGRYWAFDDGATPTIETLLHAQAGEAPMPVVRVRGVGQHADDAGIVSASVFFVRPHVECERRMVLDLDFNRFPLPVVPQALLFWWLLARGTFVDEKRSRGDIEREVRVNLAENRQPRAIEDIITTHSVYLRKFISGTARVPMVRWVPGSEQQWCVEPNSDDDQDCRPLVAALLLCVFGDYDCASTAGHKKEYVRTRVLLVKL
jgi:hypothetical protein